MGKKVTDNRTEKIVFTGSRDECIEYRNKLKHSEQPFFAITDKKEGDEVNNKEKKEVVETVVKEETPEIKKSEEDSKRTKVSFNIKDIEGDELNHELTISFKERNFEKVESKQKITTEEKETLLSTLMNVLTLYSKS